MHSCYSVMFCADSDLHLMQATNCLRLQYERHLVLTTEQERNALCTIIDYSRINGLLESTAPGGTRRHEGGMAHKVVSSTCPPHGSTSALPIHCTLQLTQLLKLSEDNARRQSSKERGVESEVRRAQRLIL